MSAFLIRLLWSGAAATALGLALLLLRRVRRFRVPPALWYAAWLIVFLRFLLPVPGVLPEAYGTARAPAVVTAVPAAPAPKEPAIAAYSAPAAGIPAVRAGLPARTLSGSETPEAVPAAAGKAASERSGARFALPGPSFWFAVWAAGALLCFGRYVFSYARCTLLLDPTLREAGPAAQAAAAGIPGRKPRILESDLAAAPVLLGILRPRILLPAGIRSETDLGYILLHELTHYRRGDLWVKWLSVAALSVHWFNPFRKVFLRELDRIMELSCDSRVLSGLDESGRADYGETLLSVAARNTLPRSVLSLSFVTGKRDLKERILQIMQYHHFGKAALAAVLLCALLLGGCLFAAAPGTGAAGNGRTEGAEAPLPTLIPAPPEGTLTDSQLIGYPTPMPIATPYPAPTEEPYGGTSSGPAKTLPPEASPFTGNLRTVTVSTVDELLAAIAPGTSITLRPGVYDLTKAADYGKETTSAWYRWDSCYDGYGLTIEGVDCLVIRAEGDRAETVLQTEPRYATVLTFSGCRSVALGGFTAGHTTVPGECSGGVVAALSCETFRIEKCALYGCGVLGVQADNCRDLAVTDSEIYECSDGAVQLSSCVGVTFDSCTFRDCGTASDDPYATVFGLYGCYGAAVLNSEVYGNFACAVVSSEYSQQVYFLGNEVKDNRIPNGGVFVTYGNPVYADACSFDGSAPMYGETGSAALPDGTPLSEKDLLAMRREPASFEGFAEIVRPAAPEAVEAAEIELPKEYASYRTVRVTNVDELLAAIAPQTVILLEEGEYDLAEATGYGAYGGEHYYWENPYDGPSLIIRGVDGLVLLGTGAGKEKVRISAEPRYADVLTFNDCRNVMIASLTAGHTKDPGECVGGVLMFNGCDHVQVAGCGLFGCGVRGVTAFGCRGLSVRDSEIYQCSWGAVELEAVMGAEFVRNDIHDCAWPTYVIGNCTGVAIDGQLTDSTTTLSLPGAGPYRKVG